MDPLSALAVADQYASDGRYAEALELLDGYRGWRRRGGFEPASVQGYRGDAFERMTRARITDYINQSK